MCNVSDEFIYLSVCYLATFFSFKIELAEAIPSYNQNIHHVTHFKIKNNALKYVRFLAH